MSRQKAAIRRPSICPPIDWFGPRPWQIQKPLESATYGLGIGQISDFEDVVEMDSGVYPIMRTR
jgi:hypothetical protein